MRRPVRSSIAFGEKGAVTVGVPYGGTPTIYRNVAIIGAATREVPQGPPGNPRAFDVVTGKKLWEFWTVPQPGERSQLSTWGDSGWKDRSGANMWAFCAPVDVERGIVYLPIAGPATNYYGGDRPGNNALRQLDRRGRCADRKVPLALPDRASRHLGYRHADGGRAVRLRAERTPYAGDRARREVELRLRARSRDWQAADSRRGAAGAEGRRADRVVFADAAVSGAGPAR